MVTLMTNKVDNLVKTLNKKIDYEKHYPTYNSAREWSEEWDFKTNNIQLYSHKIHDYPAMFIPQLARKIILEMTNERDTVLDIFLGSGTTTVESRILNRHSIGIDLNPLAILISQTKTTTIDKDSLVQSYSDFWKNYEDFGKNYEVISFKNINFWFSQEVINIFSKLVKIINEIQNTNLQRIYKVAFSSIIRKLSYCKHSGFKMHRDTKKIDYIYQESEILDEFHKSFCKVAKGVYDFSQINNNSTVRIIKGDSRTAEIDKKVDLILTSPPYGDSKTTVAYGQFSRLQSQWFGLIKEDERGNIENIDGELLGGKIKNVNIDNEIVFRSQSLYQAINTIKYLHDTEDKKNQERLKDVISFYKDLDQAIQHQTQYLKKNKYAVFVVASRTVKGVQLNTDTIIAELSREHGLELESIFFRKIPNKRIPLNVSATNIKGEICPTMERESIVILKKVK